MAAENRGEVEEPSLGVLRGEIRERDAEKGDERDANGEVEPEREWVYGDFGGFGGGRWLRGRRVGLGRGFGIGIGFAAAQWLRGIGLLGYDRHCCG